MILISIRQRIRLLLTVVTNCTVIWRLQQTLSCAYRATILIDPDGVVQSTACNHLGVARDPQDALLTALAFVNGGGCTEEALTLLS